MRAHVTYLLASSGVGLLLAVAYAASPLSAWMLLATPLLIALLGRGLPAAERRALTIILAVAFTARVLLVAAMFVADTKRITCRERSAAATSCSASRTATSTTS